MAIYQPIKKLEENLLEQLGLRKLGFAFVALLIAVFTLVVFYGQVSSFVTLENSTTLNYVSDNKIGDLVVQSNSESHTYFEEPEFEACIYPGENSAPLRVPVETEKRSFIKPKGVQRLNLTISIPEEKLAVEGINQELKLVKKDRCPLRESSKIVLVEKNRN